MDESALSCLVPDIVSIDGSLSLAYGLVVLGLVLVFVILCLYSLAISFVRSFMPTAVLLLALPLPSLWLSSMNPLLLSYVSVQPAFSLGSEQELSPTPVGFTVFTSISS